MSYTIEEIYLLGGKDDKTAVLTFKFNSDSYKKYGNFITVVFIYTQNERVEMDKLVLNEPFTNHGRIKAKYLDSKLSNDKVDLLFNEGVYTGDIATILFYNAAKSNTFHSSEKKTFNKATIPMSSSPKGKDYDWLYGFSRKLANEGVGQSPDELAFHLAGKLYYEPKNINDADKAVMYIGENLCEAVEWEYLQIKYFREDINDGEKKKLAELYDIKERRSIQILDNYLIQAGSSLKKLSTDNLDQAALLFHKVLHFKDRRLNVIGKHPIFINIDSYLHIYMRHVEEFQVNRHFEHKDNFLWKEEDVFNVISQVIIQINNEYQQWREVKPTQRFSKYGQQSLYFQGDYYTCHIEPNGRISTFHKNKKEHEK
ncbi:MAG: hypothetical protein PHU27_12170 [Salinivirgaceae bacterium]|nr:hypothetical protein [Salinivirgaceae bacterium]